MERMTTTPHGNELARLAEANMAGRWTVGNGRGLMLALMAATWPDPAEALATAQALTPDSWAVVADHADITPPSADTIALTIELLRERATS